MSLVPNIPYKTPLIDSRGFLTPAWIGFFRELYTRIGGTEALTNLELESVQTDGLDELEDRVTETENDINLLQSTSSTHADSIDDLESEIDDLKQGRQV